MSHTDQTLRESAIALPSSNCSAEVELYSFAGLVEDTCMRARTFPLAAVGSIKLFGTSPSSVVPLLLWPSSLDSKLQCIWISPTYPWHVLQLSLPPVRSEPHNPALQKEAPSSPHLGQGSYLAGKHCLDPQTFLCNPETLGNLRKSLFWQAQ